MVDPLSTPISANDFGEIRRELMRILCVLGPISALRSSQSINEQINALCRDGFIPPPIGDFMHFIRKCRNRAEYEDYVPEGEEARAIRHAWAAIEGWWLRQCTMGPKPPGSGGDSLRNGRQL